MTPSSGTSGLIPAVPPAQQQARALQRRHSSAHSDLQLLDKQCSGPSQEDRTCSNLGPKDKICSNCRPLWHLHHGSEDDGVEWFEEDDVDTAGALLHMLSSLPPAKLGDAQPQAQGEQRSHADPCSWKELERSCQKLDEANIKISALDLTCMDDNDDLSMSSKFRYNFCVGNAEAKAEAAAKATAKATAEATAHLQVSGAFDVLAAGRPSGDAFAATSDSSCRSPRIFSQQQAARPKPAVALAGCAAPSSQEGLLQKSVLSSFVKAAAAKTAPKRTSSAVFF